MQRLEARPRLLATATATFHFISFRAWFRFGFLALLNGCAARSLKYETELKCDNDSRDSSVATRYKCILVPLWLCLGSLICLLHVACVAWWGMHSFHTHIFPCCMCVTPNSTQSHVFFVCVSVSPNWYATLLLLLVCSKLNWQRVLPRIQQSTTPSTHNPQYNPTRLTPTKLKHKNLKLSL